MVDSRTPYPSSHKSWFSGKWDPNLQYFCFLSILGDFPTMIMGERVNKGPQFITGLSGSFANLAFLKLDGSKSLVGVFFCQ